MSPITSQQEHVDRKRDTISPPENRVRKGARRQHGGDVKGVFSAEGTLKEEAEAW